MNRIYLASRYARIDEMRQYRERLAAHGMEVTSRWLNGEHQIAHDGKPLGADRERLVESQDEDDIRLKAYFAQEDLSDIANSDVLLAFTEEPGVIGRGRGGRHVEFGMALTYGLPIIVIGPRENVFYCLPWLEHAADFDAALTLLTSWMKREERR